MADNKEEKWQGEVVSIRETIDPDGNKTIEIFNVLPDNPSVELSMDSKGNIKPSVKVYDWDVNEAVRKAKAIMDDCIEYINSK